MSEITQQFRKRGWIQSEHDSRRWDHPNHPSVFFPTDVFPSDFMVIWMAGFAAGELAARTQAGEVIG